MNENIIETILKLIFCKLEEVEVKIKHNFKVFLKLTYSLVKEQHN